MDEKEYSLVEHLADLRLRLTRATAGVAIMGIACFGFSTELLEALRQPMLRVLKKVHGESAQFVVSGATEYLVCQMKAALVAGLFLASPWVLWQIWQFIAPGLYDKEKRYVRMFVIAGAFFFCAGGVFCYIVVFPRMFEYLLTSLPKDIAMLPNLEEHFTFSLKMILGFGAAFETPVVIYILSLAGIVDPNSLTRYRRHVVVITLIAAAVLTPDPSPLSMFLLAGPLYVLFEFGVLVSRLTIQMSGKPLDRKAAAEEAAAAQAKTASSTSTKPDT